MEKDTFTRKLGKRVAKIRLDKGITQVELAKLCKKKKQSIFRFESGGINATAFYCHEIARALKVPVSELLDF